MAAPSDGIFNLNVNFVLAVAALFIGLINTLWDRIRLEHRITKMETIQEIFLTNMTEDAVHAAKHPTQKRKDDLIDKGIKNLTDAELEELHILLVEEIPALKKSEDQSLPSVAVSKAMVEIEQFKRAYPPQKNFFSMVFNFVCGNRKCEDACNKALGKPKKTESNVLEDNANRNIIRDSARDATRDTIRDRTRDEIRDKDRDSTHDDRNI